MSRICVKSRRTNNIVFIPVAQILEIGVNKEGHTFIKRVSKETMRVYESLDDVHNMVKEAYGQTPSSKPQATQVTQVTQRQQVVVQPYRAASRGDRVVDTALGVGLGVLGAEVIGEVFDGIFGTDWF